MKKRFCSRLVSLRINNALLRVREKSERKPKDIPYPFKCKVITPHCKNPPTVLSIGFKSQWVLFPSNISIVLCCREIRSYCGGSRFTLKMQSGNCYKATLSKPSKTLLFSFKILVCSFPKHIFTEGLILNVNLPY